jgi:asparagine synthase (glutamine-hydrolysing)
MRGSERPGQTLSGGLDSRAILAEGASHSRRWSALTYGVPGCDDARIAERAARAAGAEWEFVPLYQGDWLGARTAYVQQTDGLIQLGDLAHLEALPQQVARMDLHLSGYIGDAVAGPTFDHVRSLADAAVAMPFYETRIGLGWDHAIERLSSATSAPEWVGSRYALFEHKLPQSTNRWSTAWRPWLRVRKPFTDYRLFDYCMTTPWALRRDLRVYERFLCRAYPALFRSIPNQKTGAPPGAGPWRLRIARAMRVARRVSRATAAATGVRLRPWSRAYVNDGVEWARPDVRGRISETILRPGSVAVDVWGKRAVQDVIDDYVCRGQGPTQVIGALYVFETYHRDLSSHCREAQRRARGQRRPAATPC